MIFIVPQPNSFVFNNVDMLSAYNIRCITYDVLLPKLRSRKIRIPARDGIYDFGARNYDERTIRMSCDLIGKQQLTRQQLRDLAALLTQKGQIVLWDEPDKYYIGRIYDQTKLEYLGRVGHRTDLSFVCEPFAYGETISGPMPTVMNYKGTATTPTRIEIRNVSDKTLQGVQIQIRERSDG